MAMVNTDTAAQPRLSMIALGLLAGLAGLWVYSATREGSRPGTARRQERRQRSGALRRSRTIRRSHRHAIISADAEESLDDQYAAEIDAAAQSTLGHSETHTDHEVNMDHSGPLDVRESSDESETEENTTDIDMRLLHLLCTISEDQSRRNGIIHRGTTCNSCQESPIRGIRLKCAECANVDLCEVCEAHDAHRHHVMLRIAVPLPPLMNPHIPLIRKLYPGNMQPKDLSRDVRKELEETTCLERNEIISLYNEFCVLASTADDGTEVITREAFFKCLGKFGGSDSVIAERLFAFFDGDRDSVLTFSEMVHGYSAYIRGTLDEKIPGLFRAYDVDGDGKISRDDLRIILEAFAEANRETTKNMVRILEEDILESPSRLLPGQPISAAFTAQIPADSPSGLDKEVLALRSEVHTLRESAAAAARRATLLQRQTEETPSANRAAGDLERSSSETDSSSPSVAATTSATIGTIASSRIPRRMSTNIVPDSAQPAAAADAEDCLAADAENGDSQMAAARALPDSNDNNAAAVAAFSVTIDGDGDVAKPSGTAADLSVDLLAGDAAASHTSNARNAQLPPLLPLTVWSDQAEDTNWSVMEALCQDAVRLMIDEVFTEAAPKDPICMTYNEFSKYLKRNSNLALYMEVLGPIF
ncbi:hypothetical protein EV183_000396 [Coemansia sp. RSA 2336]|nr:hypothetical protein EV183_000396 [Coemansia sp. RSA 2336]